MKLKCDKHDRRVLTTPRGFEHRTGDRSLCDSETASISTPRPSNYYVPQVQTFAIDNAGQMHLAFVDGKPAHDLSHV